MHPYRAKENMVRSKIAKVSYPSKYLRNRNIKKCSPFICRKDKLEYKNIYQNVEAFFCEVAKFIKILIVNAFHVVRSLITFHTQKLKT